MTAPLDEARLRELAEDLLRVDHEADEWPLVLFQGRLIHIDNVLKIASDALSAERERADRQIVGWQVKDYADGWIYFRHEQAARSSAEHRNGALIRPLYAGEPEATYV